MGLHTAAHVPDAVKALMKSLTAPGAVPIIKRSGTEPG
jgi:hypothetical protein